MFHFQAVPGAITVAAAGCREDFDLDTHGIRPELVWVARLVSHAGLQRRQNGTVIQWSVFGRADLDQVTQRVRHRFHRPDLLFELQFLADCEAAYVAAARTVIGLQLEQLPYFR
jgi:hypothetical protein